MRTGCPGSNDSRAYMSMSSTRALPLAVALGLFALASFVGRRGPSARSASLASSASASASAASLASLASSASSASSLTLFKRTFASTDAMADAAFARENLGLGAAGNFSYVSEQHGTACAERAIVSALGGWQVHYFTSHVTREGSKPVDHWVALWTGLHGDYGAANWTWDEYMPMLVQLYAPDLSPFVAKLRANNVSFLATFDGPAGAGARGADAAAGWSGGVYSLFVTAPYSGHVYQIFAANVSVAAHRASFAAPPASSCAPSLRPRQAAADLRAAWAALGGVGADGRADGLPSVLVAGVAEPASGVGESALVGYVAAHGLTSTNASGGAASASARLGAGAVARANASDACSFESATLSFSTSERASGGGGGGGGAYSYDVALTSVRNRAARSGEAAAEYGASLSTFEAYVAETHARYLECGSGWDRYLDWHVGVMVGASRALDAVADGLCAAGAGFTAHRGSEASDQGSVWSAGVGALAVEFHGDFDYSYFDEADLDTLDYCSADSSQRSRR